MMQSIESRNTRKTDHAGAQDNRPGPSNDGSGRLAAPAGQLGTAHAVRPSSIISTRPGLLVLAMLLLIGLSAALLLPVPRAKRQADTLSLHEEVQPSKFISRDDAEFDAYESG